jgi:hypothetical protein
MRRLECPSLRRTCRTCWCLYRTMCPHVYAVPLSRPLVPTDERCLCHWVVPLGSGPRVKGHERLVGRDAAISVPPLHVQLLDGRYHSITLSSSSSVRPNATIQLPRATNHDPDVPCSFRYIQPMSYCLMTIDRSAGNKIWPKIAAGEDMALALQNGLLTQWKLYLHQASKLHVLLLATFLRFIRLVPLYLKQH